ncbi:hypothetical protein C8R46DRAFT_1082302 [Mycena filopes]|nr:hypothetical protein C8R46DRAFT_1082302 [Mycena filopes]
MEECTETVVGAPFAFADDMVRLRGTPLLRVLVVRVRGAAPIVLALPPIELGFKLEFAAVDAGALPPARRLDVRGAVGRRLERAGGGGGSGAGGILLFLYPLSVLPSFVLWSWWWTHKGNTDVFISVGVCLRTHTGCGPYLRLPYYSSLFFNSFVQSSLRPEGSRAV